MDNNEITLKSVFVVYNQAHTEKVEYLLDILGIRGFTRWENLSGRGSVDGNPHMGTHTWPESNSATMMIIESDKVEKLLDGFKKINQVNTDVGIRAFVWDITQAI